MAIGIRDRVRSLLDDKIYRVSGMGADMAALRLVDAATGMDGEHPVLETLERLDIYYKKIAPYGDI